VRLRRTLPDGETILYPLPPGAFDLGAPDFEGRVGGGTTTVVPVPESALTTGADLGPYYDLEVSADGLVWISGDGYFGALWRFDPDAWIWERVDLGTGQGTLAGEVLALPLSAGGIEATCDGSLWVLRAVFHLGGTEDWSLAGIGPDGSMAEFEPDLPAGDLPDAAALGLSGTDAARVQIEPGAPCGIVADNRAVWLFDGEHWGSIYEPQVFGGVVRFDGTTWTRFLDGEVVWDLSLADDGSAEASSHRDSGRTITLEP
jgi:hypothetical protein